ncbi:hypothetical protein [Luminiphilus sp. nBUS_07]|uniref:hypothetical protein n=1 Tax=Luminiphilus sp. nBUS_07 TaxID=3395314 RepID=UPI003EB7CF4B
MNCLTNKKHRLAHKPADDGGFFIKLAIALRPLTITLVMAPLAAVHANPHAAFNGLLDTVSDVRAGSEIESGDGASEEACDTTAKACYISDVEPVVQQSCVVCHKEGLTADQQGARLLFTDDASSNHSAMEAFVTTDGVGADWLLDKIVGDRGHGGGPVLTRGGADYLAFADYLTLLVGANTDDGSVDASAIWSGTTMESRETTLRRAAILLAGKVPTKAALKRATASDAALKWDIKRLMSGDGFHDFLVTAANDRLLTDGLNNGIDWQFDFRSRFPVFYAFELSLPERMPEEFDTEEYWDRPFLSRNDANNEIRIATIREPVELIAHIVENDRSYKEVVTADYTMVNQFTAMAYQADVSFDEPITDDNGFYNRKHLNVFKPAKNAGHIPFTNDTFFDQETGDYAVSEYHEWPHSGVLSMPAWLGRYPSTDTNRNRARARWTYYHFLGVDIEKSAPRSTDPVALADTNNPTMNNPACTVCHERMDPVAGAYQNFGDQGHYLDTHGGLDSLPYTYKNPQRPDGELYQLVHGNSEDSGAHVLHELTQTFSTGGDGSNFAVSEATPQSCIEDEENSTQDQWAGWCSRLSILDVAVYADGAKVVEIKASEFETYPGFSVDTYIDNDSGEVWPRGYLTQISQGTAYVLHGGSWISFDLDLPEGEYEIVVNLTTQMDDGHPESTLTAGLLWSEGFYSGDNQYQYGDTWYRDMRSPGFNGKGHTSDEDSIQWLGQQIANDPRFAKATVKFWWPAVFGAEALVAPTDRSLPDYEGQLLAFNAQEALVEELAAAFTAGGYKLKNLLADMVVSPWFRTTEVNQELSETQQKALLTVGRGRLLTPEELDRKNRAVFGRTWGEHWQESEYSYEKQTNFTSAWSGYASFYGGIDSAAVTKRNREKTPLMSNVSEKMAVELACQVVLEDFARPQAERRVFTEVEKTISPMSLGAETYSLEHGNPSGTGISYQVYERILDFDAGDGGVSITLQDQTNPSCIQDEENSTEDEWRGWCRNVGVASVEVYKSGRLIESLSADEFESSDAFVPQMWTDNETGETSRSGWFEAIDGGKTSFYPWSGWGFTLNFDLSKGDYELKVELVSRVDDGYPDSDALTAEASIVSRSFDASSASARAVGDQLDALYLRATGSVLSDEVKNRLLQAFVGYASTTVAENGNRFDGHCGDWQIWDYSLITNEDRQRIRSDSVGSLRAWTLMVHALMTSYSYLHD